MKNDHHEGIKCKHCDDMLDSSGRPSHKEADLKWYFRKSSIVIALFCVGPLALPLIWWRPNTSLAWKIGLTIVILALSWLLYQSTLQSIQTIKEYYKMLNSM